MVTAQNVIEFQDLKRKQNSTYKVFEKADGPRLEEVKKLHPEYLQVIKIRKLTIEEWSFLKILYGHLKKDQFLKLICSFDYTFFENLILVAPRTPKRKANPIQILFTNHCVKIAEGKVNFI